MTSMPKFLTAYGERKKSITPSGSKIENTYGYEINKRGQKVLAITGSTNVYEKIQADLEESKIENVLARVAAGDNSVFRPDGIYTDIVEAPKSLLEAKKQMQILENTWNELPQKIKNKYDNDVEVFIGKSGQKEWLKDMGWLEKQAEKISKEVKQQEKTVEEKGVTNES